jgi:hypothetical protein
MQFIGSYLLLDSSHDHPVPLDQRFALEFRRDDNGLEMAAISSDLDISARHAGLDKFNDSLCFHSSLQCCR